MMISSKESCGTDLPSMAGTRRNTMFSQGFYNPPYQISGQQYMAGTIATVGPVPMDPSQPFVVFVGKMNLRETPSITGVKTGKTTAIGSAYKVTALSLDTSISLADMKLGDRQRYWALVNDGNADLGWACIREELKVGDPNQTLAVDYAVYVPEAAPLSDAALKKAEADKKANIESMNKWAGAHSTSSGGSKNKDKTTDAKTGSEDTSSGLSTTSMVLIGLGAAALVYFLIQKGKK